MSKIPLPPAAGADAHVSLALLNSAVTLPGAQRLDDLGSPADATRWLIAHDLVPAQTELLAYCQNQLTDLRSSLRALFDAHVDARTPTTADVEAVNSALRRVSSAPLLHHHRRTGFYRAPDHPVTRLVEHAMAQIAEDAAALLTGDDAARVARCHASPCDRFLLRTHARRRWCSTRCGDRIRAARAYARKSGRASS